MIVVNSILLDFIRAGLWGKPVLETVRPDSLQKILQLAKHQSVLGIVANVILSSPDLKQNLKEGQESKLRKFILNNYGAYSKLGSSLMKLIGVLEADGIKPVLLKGHGLAQFYPVPELRQCGDIDIYVGPDQFDRAKTVLLSLSSLKGRPHETKKHVEVCLENTIVELHRFSSNNPDPHLDETYQKFAEKGLCENTNILKVGSQSIAIPSDTFNAFYVFYHLWRHFLTEGVGLRQLCDWMMLLHARKDYIDVGYLRQMVSDMRLMKPWKAFAAIIVDSLGAPPEDVPFYDASYTRLAKRILKRILKEGNFGHQRSYYKSRKNSYVLMKIHAFWCHFERYIALFMLFPSHAMNQFAYMFKVGIKAIYQDITQ